MHFVRTTFPIPCVCVCVFLKKKGIYKAMKFTHLVWDVKWLHLFINVQKNTIFFFFFWVVDEVQSIVEFIVCILLEPLSLSLVCVCF